MISGIAVVDDDILLCKIITLFMRQKAPQCPVYSCTKGVDVIALCATTPLRCILTDYSLADTDGVTLTHTLTARWPHIPVVLITGYVTASIHSTARQAGCVATLIKPVSIGMLWDTIQPLLGDGVMTEQGPEMAYDPSARRERVAGAPVPEYGIVAPFRSYS